MKQVWVLYIYKVKTAMLRSIHKTKEGAEKSLKAQSKDGFVTEYSLYD